MQLIKYNPWQDLDQVNKTLNKIWDNDLDMVPFMTNPSTMDLYEDGTHLIAEVNLHDFKKEEITIKVDDSTLEISAEHIAKDHKGQKHKKYYLRESEQRYWRRVALPANIAVDQAQADFKQEVLKVTIPLREVKEPTQLKIT